MGASSFYSRILVLFAHRSCILHIDGFADARRSLRRTITHAHRIVKIVTGRRRKCAAAPVPRWRQ